MNTQAAKRATHNQTMGLGVETDCVASLRGDAALIGLAPEEGRWATGFFFGLDMMAQFCAEK